MILKSIILLSSLLTTFNLISEGQTKDTLIRLGGNHLFVVDLDVISKKYSGICDCSVGGKEKNNVCSLYEIKINKIIRQADSTIISSQELYKLDSVIINEKFERQLIAGKNYLVMIGVTSSHRYFQITGLLDINYKGEYKFSQYAYLKSIACKNKRLTIKRK